MKNRINEILEGKRKYFTDIADYIWANPELAYREYKSAKALKDAMVECRDVNLLDEKSNEFTLAERLWIISMKNQPKKKTE